MKVLCTPPIPYHLLPSSIIIKLVQSMRKETKWLTCLQEESSKASGGHGTGTGLEALGSVGDLERARADSSAWANRGLCWRGGADGNGSDWCRGHDWDSLCSRRERIGVVGDNHRCWLRAVGCEV